MPFQPIVPTWLAINACNDTSPSYFTDLRLGIAVFAGGLNLGDYFDLTNGEAAKLSYTTTGLLYGGRYRRVQVDSGATAGNVKTGTIGLMASLAAVIADGDPAGKPTANIVTSYDQSIGGAVAVRPCIFLNSITPGNFGFVQELGIATVLGRATLTNSGTISIGDFIDSSTNGLADDPTGQTNRSKNNIGTAIDLPKNNGLFRISLFLPTWQD
jgi:hypothetical protein